MISANFPAHFVHSPSLKENLACAKPLGAGKSLSCTWIYQKGMILSDRPTKIMITNLAKSPGISIILKICLGLRKYDTISEDK